MGKNLPSGVTKAVLCFNGNAALDYSLPERTHVCVRENHLFVSCAGRMIPLSATAGEAVPVACDGSIVPGSKVTVGHLPVELLRGAENVAFGGGGLNSARAAAAVLADRAPGRIRYLEAGPEDPALRAWAGDSIEVGFAGIRESLPVNAVYGSRNDKVVFKSLIPAGAPSLSARQIGQLEWLLRRSADERVHVLINSSKDEPVVDYFASAAGSGKIDLGIVVTKSLPPSFLPSVLGAVDLIVVGADEVAGLFGLRNGGPLALASATLDRLRTMNESAILLATLGKLGVLVQAGARSSVMHVHLQPAVSAEVQGWVERNPRLLNGAGDAFAAGAFIMQATGNSVLKPDGLGAFPKPIQIALAGCASSLTWMGYDRHLCAGDFRVEEYGNRRELLSAA